MTTPVALRFRDRHVHKSIAEFIKLGLTELGWINAPINFGSTAFTFKEYQPETNGEDIAPNTAAVSAGDPGPTEPAEMGQGLWHYSTPVFIDIYGEQRELAKAVAGDVHDWIFRHPLIRVQDWTDPSNPQPTDVYVEWENIEGPLTPAISFTATDIKRNWKVVKVEAHTYYLPQFYDRPAVVPGIYQTSYSNSY